MTSQSLDEILRARFHGAVNITGIRYQLLYSVMRLFDLYLYPDSDYVQFEGIEDVDVRNKNIKGLNIANKHIQVKGSRNKQGWSWLKQEKILDHFLEILQIDNDSHFVIVTNFQFTGQLLALANYCNSGISSPPESLVNQVKKYISDAKFQNIDARLFLSRLSFEYREESEIIDTIHQSCIQYFELQTAIEPLYFSHLIGCAVGWAANRVQVTRHDMEIERLRVSDWISLGTVNPAVQSRLVTPLYFDHDATSTDYYEGKDARPSHIVANLDAPRKEWLKLIEDKFQRAQVCIIKSSSGQGKSTLLYRYAFDHFIENAVYRINGCENEEQVGQIVEYLKQRLSLKLPLLVIIDPLTNRTQQWHRIVASLIDQSVHFLIATREEDWHRYGQGTSAFLWDMVIPTLSLQEAQRIFQRFQKEQRIAKQVLSAEWAYAQVEGEKLLIEFIYLITQGQMLAERIRDQVNILRQESSSKVEILRLVATAHIYGASISLVGLLQEVKFDSDPDAIIQSLQQEYITCESGFCFGIHSVRSQHLVHSLHNTIPIEHTISRLIYCLDQTNLITLISQVFSQDNIQREILLDKLVERCHNLSLGYINLIIDALFSASEVYFLEKNRLLINEAISKFGSSAIYMLSASTLPAGGVNVIQELQQALPDNQSIQNLKNVINQIKTREEIKSQVLICRFLKSIIQNLDLYSNIEFKEVAIISNWYLFFSIPSSSIDLFFIDIEWMKYIWQQDDKTISLFLDTFQHRLPDQYSQMVLSQRDFFLQKFCRYFHVLNTEIKDNEIHIEFIVDRKLAAAKPNDQAISRLEQLRLWFPIYSIYSSQGLDPITGDIPQFPDDTSKRIARETLQLMLHAPKNAVYLRIFESQYSSISSYEWIDHWYQTRRKFLEFGQAVIQFFNLIYCEKAADENKLRDLGIQAVELEKHNPRIPLRLAKQFNNHQKLINSWGNSYAHFIRHFFGHSQSGVIDKHKSLLMRINLNDAIKGLPKVHQAFHEVLQTESNSSEMQSLDEQELKLYPYIIRVLNFWCEGTKQKTSNLLRTVDQWERDKDTDFALRIRQLLAPLADAGMTFLYPVRVFEEFPLYNICIGFEIISFELLSKQIELICQHIIASEFNYTYLYLVPTIRSNIYNAVIRVSFDTLRKLFAGEQAEGIFPVSIPEGMVDILPGLQITPMPDMVQITQVANIATELVAQRNIVGFARSRLDPTIEDEAILLNQYQTSVIKQINLLQNNFDELYTIAILSNIEQGKSEWIDFWNRAKAYIQQLTDLSFLVDGCVPQLSTHHPLLEEMAQQYISACYIN